MFHRLQRPTPRVVACGCHGHNFRNISVSAVGVRPASWLLLIRATRDCRWGQDYRSVRRVTVRATSDCRDEQSDTNEAAGPDDTVLGVLPRPAVLSSRPASLLL